MDEIALTRHFRADLPPIRQEARATARASLGLRFEGVDRPSPRPAWPGVRLRRRAVVVAAALAAIVAVGASIIDLGGKPGVESASASQVLRSASLVAAEQRPEPAPEPGQFFYIRSREAYVSSVELPARTCNAKGGCEAVGEASVLEPALRETWISPDGSTRFRTVTLDAEFFTPAQRRAWFAAGLPQPREAGLVEAQTDEGTPILDTSGLPTEPATLRHLLEARKVPTVDGPKGEAETFVLIGDLLRNTYLPPSFRAELYAIAAELPRVELLGEVRDPVGRPGIGVAYAGDTSRHELIFDPETSALLGEREVSIEPGLFDAPAGTEVGSAAYLESGVVDSSGERPTGNPEAAASGRRPSPAG